MLPDRAHATHPDSLRLRGQWSFRKTEESLARLPVAVWLGAVVAGSAVFRFGLARTSPTPWILPDEYIYSELARNLGQSGHFLVNGGPFAAWTYGPLYAVLTAPAWLLTSSSEAAYAAVQALNCIFMSSAAVFAYLLARRVLERPFAMFAAVLSVLVPSMIYTSRAMTESIAYPLFLAAMLGIVVMLERPSSRSQLLALGVIALSTLARAEMIILVPALVTAIGLGVLLRVGGRMGALGGPICISSASPRCAWRFSRSFPWRGGHPQEAAAWDRMVRCCGVTSRSASPGGFSPTSASSISISALSRLQPSR